MSTIVKFHTPVAAAANRTAKRALMATSAAVAAIAL